MQSSAHTSIRVLRVTAAALIVAFSLLAVFANPPSALAASARYSAFDVDLTVQNDGSYHVEETQIVEFTGGPFQHGHRDIPLARTGGITNVAVYEIVDGQRVAYTESEDSDPQTFESTLSQTEIDIQWTYDQVSNDTRTFVVAYDVASALRLYPDATPPNQQVWYTPISSALTKETPVDSATFTVQLPAAVDPASVVIAENDKEVTDVGSLTSDNETFTFTHGSFDSGEDWEIRLQSNIVATDATVPTWQPGDDQQRANEQAQSDRDTRIAGFAALGAAALLMFGALGIGLLWYTRGRDPKTGLVASFIPEPPDDTPPAIVGVLIDEKANDHDIVSTFTDLGNRGVLAVHDQGGVVTFELTGDTSTLCPFEKELVRVVFGGGQKNVSMAAASIAIRSNAQSLKDILYKEVVDRGFFITSPETTRSNWRRNATIVTSLSILAGIAGSTLYSPWLILPAAMVTILSIVLRLMARTLPKRTEKGAEAVAKWQAFKRYLDNLEKYDTIETARANFNRYLPYAIAFGLEKSWVERFYHSGTNIPSWVDPTTIGDVVVNLPRTHRRGNWGGPIIIGTPTGHGGGGGSGDGGGIDLPDMPDLQKTSDSAARGIGGASKGAVDVLNVIGAIFEIASIFTGGGGKGGSSGGGGGGFN
ncbi:hypothetical protein BH09CHL1_BH09CHL1_24810 [soil metagenome]